jgi:DNA-binding CsgD family transcriptional regulator
MVGHGDARLADLVIDLVGFLDLDEFRRALLAALRVFVPSDYATLNDVGPEPGDVHMLADPEVDRAVVHAFAELADQNPLVERYLATQDGRAYRFSDVITSEELESRPIWRAVYEPLGVAHQLAFTLPGGYGRILGVALSRGGADYTDDERAFVNTSRPVLIQLYRNAVAYRRARLFLENDGLAETLGGAGLTPREASVLSSVAHGRSNADTGAALGISDRTAQKHLERCYRKLGTPDRSAAAHRAWRLARDEQGQS